MCNFLSLISNGKGDIFYFDWPIREKILKEELDYESDSHTSIAHYFELDEDVCNKYEFNPLTKKFEVDQLNTVDDSKIVQEKCLKLDFSKIVPALIIKDIVNPLKIKRNNPVSQKEIDLLKKWDSVGASVVASVGASVWDSVGDSVGASVWDSVWDSVGASVWASVVASVGASVWDSVWDSVWASVGDSVGAYISSFFDIKFAGKNKNPYQPAIDLWNAGLVPSFDGITWRLHTGDDAKIVYEIKQGTVR